MGGTCQARPGRGTSTLPTMSPTSHKQPQTRTWLLPAEAWGCSVTCLPCQEQVRAQAGLQGWDLAQK